MYVYARLFVIEIQQKVFDIVEMAFNGKKIKKYSQEINISSQEIDY